MVEDSGNRILVGVDGAVTRDNIADVVALGADIVVSGSAIFDGKAAADNLRFMLDALATGGARAERAGELLHS
jgi:ribulose-phosphate 3-epimerase